MALVESHHLVAHILEGHGMLAAYLWTGLLGGGGVVFKGGVLCALDDLDVV